MKIVLQRRPSVAAAWRPSRKTTYGSLWLDGVLECFTLEDEIREIPGEPVKKWKVYGQTAIPSGLFDLELQDSPRFGPDTPTIVRVPGFDKIRMHGGVDIDDTDGCVIVGDKVDEGHFEIGGAKCRAVLVKLKEKIVRALSRGEKVTIEIRNPDQAAA